MVVTVAAKYESVGTFYPFGSRRGDGRNLRFACGHEPSCAIPNGDLTYPTPHLLAVDAFAIAASVASDQDTGSFRVISGGTDCDDYTTDLSGTVAVPNIGEFTGGFSKFNLAVARVFDAASNQTPVCTRDTRHLLWHVARGTRRSW